ncbi:hypothetical protein [Proteus mirabilis]|uniref:hypothetical protein n=1 Tax=Proteus mirabilis TaxID=584 RepID=UPI0034D3EA91
MSLNLVLSAGLENLDPVDTLRPANVDNEEVMEAILEVTHELPHEELAVVEATADVEELAGAADAVAVIAGSMEALIESGAPNMQAVAIVTHLANEALSNVGYTKQITTAGLESMDNDQMIGLLQSGLEALNTAKGNIFERMMEGGANVMQKIKGTLDKYLTTGGALKAKVEKLEKQLDGKSGSATVSRKSKMLTVAGGKPSANLPADVKTFTELVSTLSTSFWKENLTGNSSDIVAGVEKLVKAKTLEEARKIVDTFKWKPSKVATINVSDDEKKLIRRSPATLGSFALVEVMWKTTGGDSAHEISADLIALGKNRLAFKRIGAESGKTQYTGTLTVPQVKQILSDVTKALDLLTVLQRNLTGYTPLTARIKRVLTEQSAVMKVGDGQSGKGEEKGMLYVKRNAGTALSSSQVSVASLGFSLPNAIHRVCVELLKVCDLAIKQM